MNKEEYINRYGIEAYKEKLQQNKEWHTTHPEEAKERRRKWHSEHPLWSQVHSRKRNRKDGEYYKKAMLYELAGTRHARRLIRRRHAHWYQPYKQIIAPESQCHHQWVPGTAEYTGVALVEADQHQHGYIDVIQILEGEITLLTEEEVRNGGLWWNG